MKTIRVMAVVAACLWWAPTAHGQARARAAREAAEMLFEQFGAKAGRSVPELTARIEGIAARYGDDAIVAMRKGGPSALGLVEAAGADGAKAVRVLAVHGEQGASRVLSRPTAMKQFLQYGDDAAAVLVRHPGVAEPLVERGGAQAVKALGAVDPRNGRRLAMLMDGELATAGHPELLGVVAKHGDTAVNFLWQNKGTLAGGGALAAFLADPEPYLSGARDIASVAGESVVKPVVGGVFTLLNVALGVGCVLLMAVIGLAYKHGPPKAESVQFLLSLFKK
ncbi:hypothetical protein [Frigoriglobus tundricola]|uniref:Uncharacterized protein n=1 Tax=Frigoriglobus tundricola TaxID=2774151 RepID=A0A6M5YZX6_9BACT|nr:hypothetical protein [Frigoriglobus tundricola]QJW98492.1 hypothetical protein FTUN_6082 [Frigoriglobus tundricola]